MIKNFSSGNIAESPNWVTELSVASDLLTMIVNHNYDMEVIIVLFLLDSL